MASTRKRARPAFAERRTITEEARALLAHRLHSQTQTQLAEELGVSRWMLALALHGQTVTISTARTIERGLIQSHSSQEPGPSREIPRKFTPEKVWQLYELIWDFWHSTEDDPNPPSRKTG
jgi:hypothetical protein